MTNPAGGSNSEELRLDFDRRLTLQFRGSVVTSDAGLLAYRELDDALGLSETAGDRLADVGTGKNGRHALVSTLLQAVFSRLAGYEDVNDAERLRHDPAMRWIVGGKAASECAASASQMGRFETRWLRAEKKPFDARRSLRPLLDRSRSRLSSAQRCSGSTLMDSSVTGRRRTGDERLEWALRVHLLPSAEQSSTSLADLERCALRPGNVHSADSWERVLKRVVARYRGKVSRIYFRADAGFANPG